MINFRNFLLLMLFCCCVQSYSSSAIEKKNIAIRNFWHPAYLGERLDYCSADGKECGKPVADRYCNMLGYAYAKQAKIAYNLGLTHYISTGSSCKGWRCNGFMTIACATNLTHTPPQSYHYREKRFTAPRYNAYRVDWCYEKKEGCGARAANSFCKRMGFVRTQSFVKETQVGATKTIGSEELCFGNLCDAFKTIVCYR